ncbi:MAG: 23S rRNA (adenine(2503)-C(2))-methyltransferase RlmN [Thermodesulfobacteriota bacterium]
MHNLVTGKVVWYVISMDDPKNFGYKGLKELVVSLDEKPYRAHQLYRWLYKQGAASFDEMSDVSKGFREMMKGRFTISRPNVTGTEIAKDGTMKLLIDLDDGNCIETVIIHEEKRATLCISTQVGCPLDCGFCMTGRGGFVRNLKLSEMVNQVHAAQRALPERARITNLVLMGMGEPLLNYEEVKRFLDIATDQRGLGFAPRRITVSTAGIAPLIEWLGRETNVMLAVSLNGATDEIRDHLMPINRKYPLKVLLDACRRYGRRKKRVITFEYILIEGINDGPEDARGVATLLKGMPCKVNLIPFNPFPSTPFTRPKRVRILRFQKILIDSGYTTFLRESRGDEIGAACGQLRGRLLEKGRISQP